MEPQNENHLFGIYFECEKKMILDTSSEFAEALLTMAELLTRYRGHSINNMIFIRIANAYSEATNYNRYLIYEVLERKNQRFS